jgi:Lon protease-like protein
MPRDTTDSLPLFPLNAVLFPKGRIALQIFEARYVDMVRQCLRDGSGFGIVLIEQGSEVARPGQKLDIHRTGTYCEVVDWNQLPNGLLGITAEGRCTFRVLETWRESNQLCRGVVSFRHQDGVDAEPLEVGEEFEEYVDLLRGLSRHPAIEELRLDVSFENLREVAWRLSELLPIGNRQKQTLLELADPFARLQQIELYINSINQ